MTDREKVLTWLEICGKNRDCSGNCPYGDGSGEYEDRLCREDLMADALALLKEQEPVEPIPCGNSWWFFKCGACGCSINWKDKYCSECGRKVKLG